MSAVQPLKRFVTFVTLDKSHAGAFTRNTQFKKTCITFVTLDVLYTGTYRRFVQPENIDVKLVHDEVMFKAGAINRFGQFENSALRLVIPDKFRSGQDTSAVQPLNISLAPEVVSADVLSAGGFCRATQPANIRNMLVTLAVLNHGTDTRARQF